MKQWIHELFAYRRWCWNYGLGLWNDFYEESLIFEDKTLRPNGNKVRDFMVSTKHDWQYLYSSRVLQIAIIDLEKAWKNFFNPKCLIINVQNLKVNVMKIKLRFQQTERKS